MSLLLDNKALELENEIRKLKLQLLKEELSDKLLILNTYLDKKDSSQNTTSQELVKDSNDSPNRFESVLFANVSGDFLVWHIVLFGLIFWVLTG